MNETTPLPEEEAERVAKDASLEDGEATRILMALLIEQLGAICNVMISIDDKMATMMEEDERERLH